ncbi:MAG TPA: tripartite tricarboxylate transporter substrate binding protein [Pseudolabrys sp.]|nr:tripartite tricarboxylate transporter substrate binding protein [Pseudolabrys sp.]
MKRSLTLLLLLVGLVFATLAASAADKYPTRPVRIIVPYAPGGATDIVARVLGEQLKNILGQNFFVESKPGAYGIIAIEDMVKSKDGGYTLLVGNVSTNAITPVIYAKKFKIDYRKDVVPVATLVDIPEFLIVSTKDFTPKTVPEFIDYVKKNPGKVNYGSVGVGSYPDYDMALFAKRAGGLQMQGIPNKGGASGVINDMLAGSTQASFLNVASTAGLVKAGQLRPLALVNRARLPEYPDVPTMQEVGYPGVGTLAWQALFAPADTPKEVIATLRAAVAKALKEPALLAAFGKQNFNVMPQKPEDAPAWLAEQMKAWKQITEEVNIKIPE